MSMFKEKEEMQEYIKNLGIEYRFSCYSEKDSEGCQLLGDYMSQIHQDFEKAHKIYKENCDQRNHPRSCSSLGMLLLSGKGYSIDYPLAIEYFSKACELNDATGCDFAGKLLTNCEPDISPKIQLDAQRGMRYLERGCNLETSGQPYESSESCYAAAFAYAVGKDGIQKDAEKAIQLGARACDMGQINGCKLTTDLYSRLGDHQKALEFKKKFNEIKSQLNSNDTLEMQRT